MTARSHREARARLLRNGALALILLLPFVVRSGPLDQPLRWVLVDDMRVRTSPSFEQNISVTLSRGTELNLLSSEEANGFCLIEVGGLYGFAACKYLSAERVTLPRAGENGVDVAQRWVSGNAVNLRDAARIDAEIVGRLPLNQTLRLVRDPLENGYCEVELLDARRGYTACRYLTTTPTTVTRSSSDGVWAPGQDPERAFWLQPGWNALERYAQDLTQRHPNLSPSGPWPRDDALEQMKAHLALGLMGRKPVPLPDWRVLKRKAMRYVTGEHERPTPDEIARNKEALLREQWFADTVQELLSAFGSATDASQTTRLAQALSFPEVRPSLFRSETEVAPPGTSTEEASGRFGIVFRDLVAKRPSHQRDGDTLFGAGLYDMLAHTQVLVRPVQRVQLFRNGELRIEPSLVRQRKPLWRETDEPMCSDWAPGFGFGDAQSSIWRYFGTEATATKKLDTNPPGSLYAFYTNRVLPVDRAVRAESTVNLDRAATGFVEGTHLHYDLDGDGIFDLSVWEGVGKGPGHLEGTTLTDDRWYRLALVNVNGAWKVLGADTFDYGCGC